MRSVSPFLKKPGPDLPFMLFAVKRQDLVQTFITDSNARRMLQVCLSEQDFVLDIDS